ncbi:MAG: type VI secretion system tip protein TssI/VgrG, partial [Candidatus Paceibacterota bacterium]
LWSQHDRLLRLSTPLAADTLLAESLDGLENLDGQCRLDITALSEDAHLALKSLLGQPALLQLQTALSRTELRPFHGHITRIEAVGANGGVARYRLRLEPWTAFLAHTYDSAVYQDMTVADILDAIFHSYQGQGKLNPQWRFDLADPSSYPKRSLTCQYQESDAAFVQRLLYEEGLFSWIEHQGDPGSQSLGSHTLVIADHNGAFKANVQADIDYAQPGSTLPDDRIDRWRAQYHSVPQAVSLQSWDYRSLSLRPVSASGTPLNPNLDNPGHYQDSLGGYAYSSRSQGQRRADRLQEALNAHQHSIIAEGSVRTLAPASQFKLHGHSHRSSQDSQLIWQVRHQAHNNLSADLHALVAQNLGLADTGSFQGDSHASGQQGLRALYRNRVDSIPAQLPYRNRSFDSQGQLLHPKPSTAGQQTAIVVGAPGEAVHTDRDHRIKVQFHWQRGPNTQDSANSHSRLPHPRPGHSGAPANHQAGTWVRVLANLAAIAGANWGSQQIPRVGQEVLIDFIEGDIDRPVVIASLYNGQAQADAQYNPISQGAGAAIGGHSPWFPGQAGGHAHPASLSGLKSQALSASQQGSGAYNQLVFDDSPGESRTSLQHHAQAHQGSAELNLGHLRHQSDNQRLNPAGFGAELKSQHSVALRAGQGLLLSTDARANAQGHQLDSQEASAQTQQSQQLQDSLNSSARQHNAGLAGEANPLPAIQQQAHSLDVLQGGGDGQAAYSEPQLQLSSPAGIIASTPQDAIFSAGHTSSLSAGHDINLAAQGNHHHLVAGGISLYTYGTADNANKPNTETGIKLHAATGKASLQSQSGEARLSADQGLTVASSQGAISIAAPQHILLTAQGAGIRLEGGNITLNAPGSVAFKASMKELMGAGSTPNELPVLPTPQNILGNHYIELNLHDDRLQPVAQAPYKLVFDDGTTINGKLDAQGHARVEGIPSGAAKVYYGDSPKPYSMQLPDVKKITDENLAQDLKKAGLNPEQVDLQALIEQAAGRANL